ncbi:YisL family protein [Filibacter tadaridae]|uniref:UPF0344 protein FILTAD_01635 n=1 Tax=Filibacter tadaridae TaxID=2483811 RepID=A0A3P5X9L8_9BACL|nr:YisL family protein [Filibacter tadaridae]VDC27540.1 hypothetical protein FILTAD_01635 [Filibacter tadaridae]
MDVFTSTTHLHIFTWVVGIILFIVVSGLEPRSKGRKIAHMIVRLFYVLILLTGAFLFFEHSSIDGMLYGMKFLFGLLTIGMMEMVLVRSQKGKSVSIFWILFLVFVLVTMFLGFKLPIGFDWFA